MTAFGSVFFWMLALAGLPGCSRSDVPDFIIPEDTMALILKDMHIVHAGVDLSVFDGKQRETKYQQFNRAILDRYAIPKDRFLTSFDHYQGNPVILDSIYSRVIDHINLELAPLQKKVIPKTKVPIAE